MRQKSVINTSAVLFLAAHILFSFTQGQARVIWRIGDPNNDHYSEFQGSLDQAVATCPVPDNWDTKVIWESFPPRLCHPESHLKPEEIHITFNYPRDCLRSVLRIRAKAYTNTNFSQGIAVFKGENPIPVGESFLISEYALFEFPLGIMQKDFHESNKIILKNRSLSDNKSIYFDYLELDNQDEEGTWPILIPDAGQSVIKWISLKIPEDKDPAPYLQELNLLDQNSPGFPLEPPSDLFFPYGLFKAKIQVPDVNEDISLVINYSGPIYPLAQFYFFQESGGWHELSMTVLDENKLVLSLSANLWRRGEEGQQEEVENVEGYTLTSITGGLAYPQEMNIALEKNECFVTSLPSLPMTLKQLILLSGFLLILFILPWCCPEKLTTWDNTDQDKGNVHTAFSAKKPLIILIIFIIVTIFSCLLLKAALTFAISTSDMKMSSTPNPIGSGARALGLGGAFIAVADDATAASWNPSGLLHLPKPEISMVVSHFSGKADYRTSGIEGNIENNSSPITHLNYLSLAVPFMLFRRHLTISFNYQQLYEFSQDVLYHWKYEDSSLTTSMNMESHKRQKGGLNTLSPALAVEITPTFFVGLTTNFWLDRELKDHWENVNIVQGEGWDPFGSYQLYAELYERYDFSGFNTHIGFLWRPNYRLTLGGVFKSSFDADLRHEYRSIFKENYPENPARNDYRSSSYVENLTLTMPASYGLGAAINLFDNFLVALDIYHAQWQSYTLGDPNGEISPINNEPKDKAHIKPTTQIRLGIEYVLTTSRPNISIRSGIFYDPEPASGRVDDFYGASLGTGIKYDKIAFDFAYQFRFGQKRKAEDMLGKVISSEIKQHYLYASVIFSY